ncbi:S-isoprenylcysteine O-methyltransferase [Clarias magur]|uniref:S-isoprenylcysteine O-methyltransferase n=1 Tax=Clarias magur TaxID=1594786 RepID=A0A8J4WZH3_CLAMG|nr:S-isoprenylcysteine O-methyltransferase [Clarias magur]
MPAYMDITSQDNIHHARCKLHSLERKCFSKVEKLKSSLEEHLHNGIPTSDLLEKTVSFFTMRKALVFHNGYSRCTRDILRLCPSPTEDVTPLFFEQ